VPEQADRVAATLLHNPANKSVGAAADRTVIPRNNAMPDLFSSPVDRNRAGRGEVETATVEDVANNSAVGPADRRSRHHRRHPVYSVGRGPGAHADAGRPEEPDC
jgi:hypothetical protein